MSDPKYRPVETIPELKPANSEVIGGEQKSEDALSNPDVKSKDLDEIIAEESNQ